MKYSMTSLLLLILFSLTSCNNDDDNGNQEPELGFFPTKIILEDGGTTLDIEFTYDNKNQIALITSDLFSLSFAYYANGLIAETRLNGTSTVISTTYDGEIVTSLTETDEISSDIIPVSYTNGTYSTNSAIIKLNPQNQVLELYGSPITYSNNSGPFTHLKFQPALFITADIVPIYSYFFATHEITEFEFPFNGITYTVDNTRDANNNIVFAQWIDPMGNEDASYTIEYEERPLIN
ncbi:MAG: hypothetical protein WA775_02710 [Psychroserpens sp.]|uniref:hypothetical protein n=1 Tax=Psychroserpens sp. TaxID=2020870 RepID=UPI003CABCF18